MQTRSVTNRHGMHRVVAVTGASSFLGRNLVGLLEEHPRVSKIIAIDVRSPVSAGPKTHFYEVDVTQPTSEEHLAEILSAETAHTLVHVAFLSSPTHATGWSHEFESVGTMHILNAARVSNIRKIVHWSQTLLYGARPGNPNYLDESTPLTAQPLPDFLRDKVEAEREAQRFGQTRGKTVTILRTAPILGPTVHNFVTRFLSHRVVPKLMGFDPLCQFVHEVDAVAAFMLAINRDVPGVFNIASEGVLPLSTVIQLAGRLSLPIPHPLAFRLASALWFSHLSETPPRFLDYLRYLCVADGRRATSQLGFRPAYTTREAVLDFATAQHLRDVRLLDESIA